MPRQAGPERGEGMKVSIIVPVYYGRKYIKEIIGMAERNSAQIDGRRSLCLSTTARRSRLMISVSAAE